MNVLRSSHQNEIVIKTETEHKCEEFSLLLNRSNKKKTKQKYPHKQSSETKDSIETSHTNHVRHENIDVRQKKIKSGKTQVTRYTKILCIYCMQCACDGWLCVFNASRPDEIETRKENRHCLLLLLLLVRNVCFLSTTFSNFSAHDTGIQKCINIYIVKLIPIMRVGWIGLYFIVFFFFLFTILHCQSNKGWIFVVLSTNIELAVRIVCGAYYHKSEYGICGKKTENKC